MDALAYKWHGKTVRKALPTAAAVRKAEQEVAEFRNHQQLSRELVEVSEQIYRLRPVEETLTPKKKNGRTIQQEVAHEVDQLLRVIFADRRKSGRVRRSSKFSQAPAPTVQAR